MNRLTNAGYLELTSGWSVSGGLTLSVDEATRGSPGRATLVATGTSGGATHVLQATTGQRPAVTAGETIEVSAAIIAMVAGADVLPEARIVFRNSGGSQVSAETIAVTAPALTQHGRGRHGLRETFCRAHARMTVPATATTAAMEVRVTATSGQSVVIGLLKPFLDGVPLGRTLPLGWDPGQHTDADLDLSAWPQDLRPFQAQSASEPQPATVDFGDGPGRPQQRATADDPARRFNGRTRCDAVEREVLETFWRQARGDFWFVEPGSDRLCVASFAAEGAPRASEVRGPTAMMDVGLWLETA